MIVEVGERGAWDGGRGEGLLKIPDADVVRVSSGEDEQTGAAGLNVTR